MDGASERANEREIILPWSAEVSLNCFYQTRYTIGGGDEENSRPLTVHRRQNLLGHDRNSGQVQNRREQRQKRSLEGTLMEQMMSIQ